ncbi:MAG: hypothetical protein Q9176_007259 [Flavoplaca citrina]
MLLWWSGSQQLKDKEEPSIGEPPSVIATHAPIIHSQVDPGSITRSIMPMSMLPATERSASARAAPDFRQNHVVAAEIQTVPNRSSRSHPQVNSPSEYPMALVVPPEAIHQSEVAPYIQTTLLRQCRDKGHPSLMIAFIKTLKLTPERLGVIPWKNTYRASGPPAPTSSSAVLATAKTSSPLARKHSIPPLDFDSSELTLPSTKFSSPRSWVDNATYSHATSALNGITVSHRNTTPKGNSPAHQPIREQSSPAESHQYSPKQMNRGQSAATGSHQPIFDQAEREQSATTGSHRSISNQTQWIELRLAELQNASSASSPQVDGQVRHRVDRDDTEEAYPPGHVAVPENQDESSHSPDARTLRRQLKQKLFEVARNWPDAPADDELKRKLSFNDDDDEFAARVRPDAEKAQKLSSSGERMSVVSATGRWRMILAS